MSRNSKFSPPAVGYSSLIASFALLALGIFALLSLSTALAQQRLADASVEKTTAYYEADLEAEKIFARLRAGEMPAQVQKTGDLYTYRCPITAHQVLVVELNCRDGEWRVLRWQAVPQLEEAPDPTLPVWNGAAP